MVGLRRGGGLVAFAFAELDVGDAGGSNMDKRAEGDDGGAWGGWEVREGDTSEGCCCVGVGESIDVAVTVPLLVVEADGESGAVSLLALALTLTLLSAVAAALVLAEGGSNMLIKEAAPFGVVLPLLLLLLLDPVVMIILVLHCSCFRQIKSIDQ